MVSLLLKPGGPAADERHVAQSRRIKSDPTPEVPLELVPPRPETAEPDAVEDELVVDEVDVAVDDVEEVDVAVDGDVDAEEEEEDEESMRYTGDPDPEGDQEIQLIEQVREQEETIKQLRNRIVQLEEVQSANQDLQAINVKLLEQIKDLRKDAGLPV